MIYFKASATVPVPCDLEIGGEADKFGWILKRQFENMLSRGWETASRLFEKKGNAYIKVTVEIGKEDE